MNSATNKLLPKLRFPEFSEVWEKEKLGSFGDFTRGITYSSNDVTSEGLLVIRSGNIQNNNLVLENDLVFINKECPSELILKNGDIVICMSNGSKALVGKNAEFKGYNDKPITIGAFCSFFRAKNDFSKFLLRTEDYEKFIAFSIGGGNINNLKNSDLENYSIIVPENPTEQQKIANCLTSLDQVIESQTTKLALLKTHKKGLLQNLFPVDGETLPKYRFKEFGGVWEEKKLGEICNVNPTSIELPNEFIYIDLESVEKGILKKENKILLQSAPSRAQRLLEKNDIIYQTVRPYQMNNYFFQIESDMEYVASTGYAQLRAFDSSEFLFQLIHTQYFVDKVLTKCSGSNYPAINSSDLKSITIKIPNNTKEQQKIATCLLTLDNQIKAQTQKIEQLKLHKKGLMQGLFPNTI